MRYLNRINSLFALYFLSFSIFSDGHETSIDTVIEKETDSLIYIGLGSADDSDIVGEEPWSVGFIYREENNFFGLDIAGEGVKINQSRDYYDGTYYVESTEQATSFNLIAGIKVSGESNLRTDLGLLIGIVEQSEECPTSYSGYNCYYSSYYENRSDVEYTFNYGLALHATYDRVTFGIRATGESTQIIFGFNF